MDTSALIWAVTCSSCSSESFTASSATSKCACGADTAGIFTRAPVSMIVEGAAHFDVTVAVDVAPGFLVGRKKRVWQWLKVRPFLLKTGHHLFTRRAMDTLVGDTAFPVIKKEVLFTQRLKASSFQSVGAHVSDPALHFAFVLRRPGTTRNNMDTVVSAKVSQLRIDFRI